MITTLEELGIRKRPKVKKIETVEELCTYVNKAMAKAPDMYRKTDLMVLKSAGVIRNNYVLDLARIVCHMMYCEHKENPARVQIGGTEILVEECITVIKQIKDFFKRQGNDYYQKRYRMNNLAEKTMDNFYEKLFNEVQEHLNYELKNPPEAVSKFLAELKKKPKVDKKVEKTKK